MGTAATAIERTKGLDKQPSFRPASALRFSILTQISTLELSILSILILIILVLVSGAG